MEEKDTPKEAPFKDTPIQPEPLPHKHKKPAKTLGEKLIPWGQFLGLLCGALLGVYASFVKGEPKAIRAWEVLRDQVNQQSEAINKLHLRMVFLQAHQEGQNAAALQLKLDQLQVKYDSMLKQLKVPARPAPRPCKEGFTRTTEGKCEKMSAAVPVAPTLDTMKKALEEERKRMEAERKKGETIRKLMEKKESGDKILQALPPSPDDKKL
jgi:hypothetical protein